MIYNDKDLKIVDFRQNDIVIGVGDCFRRADTLYLAPFLEDMVDISDKKLSDINAQVAMIFTKLEDVDLIINQLFKVRKAFAPEDKMIQIIKFGGGKIGVVSIDNKLYIIENDFTINPEAKDLKGQEVIDIIQKNTAAVMDFDSERSVDIMIEALTNIKKSINKNLTETGE